MGHLVRTFELEEQYEKENNKNDEQLRYADILAWVTEKLVDQRNRSWEVFKRESSSGFVGHLQYWKAKLRGIIEKLKTEKSNLEREKSHLITQNQQFEAREIELKSKIVTVFDRLRPIISDLRIDTEKLADKSMGYEYKNDIARYSRVALKGTVPDFIYKFQASLNGLNIALQRVLNSTSPQSPFYGLINNILKGNAGNNGLENLKAWFSDSTSFESSPSEYFSTGGYQKRELWSEADKQKFVFVIDQTARLHMIASIPDRIGGVSTDELFKRYGADRGLLKSPFSRIKDDLSDLFFDLEIVTVSLFEEVYHELNHTTSPRNYSTILTLFPELKGHLHTLEKKTIMDIESVGLKSGQLGLDVKPHVYFTSG